MLPGHSPETPENIKWKSLSRVWLCNRMDCGPPDSSIRGVLQARVLDWVAISFSSGPSWHMDQTQVFCIAGRFFTVWDSKEAPWECKNDKYDLHQAKCSRD